MDDHVTPESRCPYCGHRFNRAANIDDADDRGPAPGDITICIACASILEYGADGVAVGLPPEREKEIAADAQVQRARAAVLALDRREMRND